MVALMPAVVLFWSGCASGRSVKTTQSSQSLQSASDSSYRKREVIRKEHLAGDTVELRIAVDSLSALPAGASWSAKSGGTELQVQRDSDGTMVVRAESAGREAEVQETVEEWNHQSNAEAREATQTEQHPPAPSRLKKLVAAIAGVLLTLGALYWAGKAGNKYFSKRIKITLK
jgi:hypothetical protein